MRIKIGRKEYEAEFNMNVVEDFEEETGKDIIDIMFSAIGDEDKESRGIGMFKTLGAKGLSMFTYLCIKEGERLAGRDELDINRRDINANLSFAEMAGLFGKIGDAFGGAAEVAEESDVQKKIPGKSNK